MQVLGVDIGGSGIKGAVVDVEAGILVTERVRIPTPQPSTPKRVARVVRDVVRHFEWHGPVGCTVPAVVQAGVVRTAANIDDKWIGCDGHALLAGATGLPVHLVNDADAAGLAEVRFGAGRHEPGVVLMLTFGTGIGSALFTDGQLVPNTELGHLSLPGRRRDAENRASDRVRRERHLSWKRWARRANEYLARLDFLFSPDLIVLGGGMARDADQFLHRLKSRARLVPAHLGNEAGIVGAALAVTRDGFETSPG